MAVDRLLACRPPQRPAMRFLGQKNAVDDGPDCDRVFHVFSINVT